MQPLTKLAAVPYALNVPDQSITLAKLAPEVAMSLETGNGVKPTSANGGAGTVNTANGCATNSDGTVGTNEVAGGCLNTIYGNVANHPIDFSTISGGQGNIITSQFSSNPVGEGTNWHTIGGGDSNSILIDINAGAGAGEQTVMGASTIGGGQYNTLSSPWGFIGGGQSNFIGNENPVVDDDGGDLMKWDAIVGGKSNSIDTVSLGSFIGGGQGNHIAGVGTGTAGGEGLFTITSHADYSTISGGINNTIKVSQSMVGGGELNIININSDHSFIGGGKSNNDSSAFAVIGGGEKNIIFDSTDHAFIGGGLNNSIESHFYTITGTGGTTLFLAGQNYSVIGGGHYNRVKAPLNVICGGDSNIIDFDQFQSTCSFIGGGHQNTVDQGSSYNVIGGGMQNENGGAWSFIGSGLLNYIFDDCLYGTIGGGRKNFIGNQSHQHLGQAENLSFIGGGDTNTINSKWGVIGGGLLNQITSSSDFSIIGGGDSNTINSNKGAIGGGLLNQIASSSDFSFIGGGDTNLVKSSYSALGGGYKNLIASNSAYSFIGAGGTNIIDINSNYSVLGGGLSNAVRSPYSVITGGDSNTIVKSKEHDFIGGGKLNLDSSSFSVIGGGKNNTIGSSSDFSIIGGGRNNVINNLLAKTCVTIPGGDSLIAQSYGQTVLGFFNLPQGSTASPTLNDDRVLILGDGNAGARRNAFEVSNNGHSIVYHTNGTGDAMQTGVGGTSSNGGQDKALGSTSGGYVGATYRDNIIYASGDVEPNVVWVPANNDWETCDTSDHNGVIVHYDFGCSRIWRIGQGHYRVRMSVRDPINPTSALTFANNDIRPGTSCLSALPNNSALQFSVVATIISDNWESISCCDHCASISVSRVTTDTFGPTFDVYIWYSNSGNCYQVDRSFNFQVTGRPVSN